MSTIAASAALPAAALVIWALLRTPLPARLVAQPSPDRWHEKPTPLLGGIGIFAGLVAGALAAVAAGAIDLGGDVLGLLGGAAVVFAAGLVDDLYHLPPLAKVATQVVAAVVLMAGGVHVEIVQNDLLGYAIGIAWIVAMTNAFNLLDNMDGLAATLAGIAFVYFAIDGAAASNNDLLLALALAGAGACAGFLPFNMRRGPALSFMGDAGSQVLGFSLAALGLVASWKTAETTVATLILPILVLAVPILDTTLVTVVRLLEGRPIYRGGRDHSSHRLVVYGLSERHAVALLALVSAGLGASSLAYSVLDDQRITLVGLLLTFVLLVQFGSFLAAVDRPVVPGEERPPLRDAFAVHWRRLIEVVVDFGLISGSFLAAHLLRFGGTGTTNQKHLFMVSLPVLIAFRYVAFIPFGLYRSVWRYASSRDLAAIVAAVASSEFLAVSFISLTRTFGDFSRSVFLIDALICTAAIGGSRLLERAVLVGLRDRGNDVGRRSLVVGAGRAGRSLAIELRETARERVVGFVDDNPRLRRRRVHGIPVVGTTYDLARVLDRYSPDIVLVTIPNAPRERLEEVVAACEAADVQCRFVRREIDLDPQVVLGAAAE